MDYPWFFGFPFDHFNNYTNSFLDSITNSQGTEPTPTLTDLAIESVCHYFGLILDPRYSTSLILPSPLSTNLTSTNTDLTIGSSDQLCLNFDFDLVQNFDFFLNFDFDLSSTSTCPQLQLPLPSTSTCPQLRLRLPLTSTFPQLRLRLPSTSTCPQLFLRPRPQSI